MSEIDGGKSGYRDVFTVAGNKWSAFQMALRGNEGSIYAFMFPSLPGEGFHRTSANYYLSMSC